MSTSAVDAYPLALNQHVGAQFANETAITPGTGGEDGPLILDVGQKTVVSSQNAVLGTLLIVLGLIQVFFGFRLIRLTLVLTGFLSCAIIAIVAMVTLHWELDSQLFHPSHYAFWAWFLSALFGGCICFRFWDLGVTFAGGMGGFAVAMGIIAATSHSLSNASRYILLAVLILLGAAIATFFERFSMIMGTSFGGAFMMMYGIDEFLQNGYREMMVIFEFAGRTLTYHPSSKVYLMIGMSLLVALLGIGWEFWHHSKPLWMDRRAVFRIYGRPFGKRPEQLMGPKVQGRVTRSDGWAYLIGCLCLRRKTAEEVLYEDDKEEDYAAISGGGGVVTAEALKENQVHPSMNSVPISTGDLGSGSDTTVVQPEGQSNAGKHSNSDTTIVSTDSGISSKTPSNHALDLDLTYDDTRDEKQDIKEQQSQDERPLSLSALTPVQIVVEETDFEDQGNGELVPVESHTELSIIQMNDNSYETDIQTSVNSDAHGTLSSSLETRTEHSSMSRTEEHHQHHTMITSTETTRTESRIVSSSSHTTTHQTATHTSSAISTGPSDHLEAPGLTGLD
ncbi:hypothetical protein EDD11_001290 [Mortierella claussenii]|nr:hypothetical protein EDD11_001290 [Mortierella claussenii]